MEIVIVGAGGFAREMHCLLPGFLADEDYQFKGYLGQDQGTPGGNDISAQILGDPEQYLPESNERFVLAIGNMPARRRTVSALSDRGARFLTLIHPLAFVAPSARLADGCIIYPYASVSNNATLAECVKLNYYASVGHDTQLGTCCLLAPYATVNGFGVLEDEAYLSTHSTVAPQVRVGSRSKISANSAAMSDIPPDSIAFGVPARVVRRMSA